VEYRGYNPQKAYSLEYSPQLRGIFTAVRYFSLRGWTVLYLNLSPINVYNAKLHVRLRISNIHEKFD